MTLVRRAGLSTITIGTLSAVGASLAFSLNDMSVKFLSGGYPLHEVVLIRSVIALTILLGVMVPLSGGFGLLRTRQPLKHLARGALILASNMSFFVALAAMPIADATAIFYVAPVMIGLFSVLFLGETVGPWRWTAIGVGLLGVVVMIRPGAGSVSLVALLPVVAATCYAALNTLTRHIGLRETALTMTCYTQFTFFGFSLLFGLVAGHGQFAPGPDSPALDFLLRGWIWPRLADLPFFLLCGIGTALGGFLIAQAYRSCEAALIAPLEYAAMPMAIFWGVMIFGEWPDGISWIGISMILGAGITMIVRESRQRSRG